MNMIASAVPGRIRVRTPALRNPDSLTRMGMALEALEGVVSTRQNRPACSIIVTYDCARVAAGEMEAKVASMAAATLGQPAPSPSPSPARKTAFRRRANRWAKYGSIASLGVSLAALAVGGKRLHAVSGGIFVAFLAVHMAVHRKHTFR